MRALGLLLLTSTLLGCAGTFGDGIALYDKSRYPEALESLNEAERDALSYGQKDRARYALYRGLVHLALGDRHSTRLWLGEAKRACDDDPRVFDDRDSGRLASAWAHLGD